MAEEKKIDDGTIGNLVIDAVLEKPIIFKLDGRFFSLYPPSLGVVLLASEIQKDVAIDETLLKYNESVAYLELVRTNRNKLLRLLALYSFKDRRCANDEEMVQARIKEFEKLEDSPLITLFVGVLQWNGREAKFIEHFGMDKEREERKKIQDYKKKNNKGGVTYGGLSMWGNLLDMAAERYGWTYDYIMWGISALNLNMMLGDSITSIYLTDEEANDLHLHQNTINADDPKNADMIRQLLKED